jgi:hypothetical protein
MAGSQGGHRGVWSRLWQIAVWGWRAAAVGDTAHFLWAVAFPFLALAGAALLAWFLRQGWPVLVLTALAAGLAAYVGAGLVFSNAQPAGGGGGRSGGFAYLDLLKAQTLGPDIRRIETDARGGQPHRIGSEHRKVVAIRFIKPPGPIVKASEAPIKVRLAGRLFRRNPSVVVQRFADDFVEVEEHDFPEGSMTVDLYYEPQTEKNPDLVVEVTQVRWRDYRHEALILEAEVRITNHSSAAKQFDGFGLQFPSGGQAPQRGDPELSRFLESRENLYHPLKADAEIQPGDSLSGWIVNTVPRPASGSPEFEIIIYDELRNEYRNTVPAQPGQVFQG